jgi:hypothetical protein
VHIEGLGERGVGRLVVPQHPLLHHVELEDRAAITIGNIISISILLMIVH